MPWAQLKWNSSDHFASIIIYSIGILCIFSQFCKYVITFTLNSLWLGLYHDSFSICLCKMKSTILFKLTNMFELDINAFNFSKNLYWSIFDNHQKHPRVLRPLQSNLVANVFIMAVVDSNLWGIFQHSLQCDKVGLDQAEYYYTVKKMLKSKETCIY